MRVESADVVQGRGQGPGRSRDGLSRFVSGLAWNVVLAMAIGAVAALVVTP